MPLLLLNIDKVIGLVKVGIATYQGIVQAIRAGKAAVHDADGVALTAEDVQARCQKAIQQALADGDAAAARIDARHGADGTGEP